MAKAKKSVFFCQNCGHEESKWLGQCPMCKEWNSFVEECVTTSNTAAVKAAKEIRIVPLSEVKTENEERVTTEIKELDRVLGGGIVPGSLILVGGDPGIGKSTLLLQVCQKLAKKERKVLYKYADAACKRAWDFDFYCRTCYKRRNCRRSKSIGTYGRYGSVF